MPSMYRVCVLGILAIVSALSRAESYMAAFDQAQWQVQSSALVCKLIQTVPHFGQAIFETPGGEQQRFMLRAEKNPLASGPAQLTAVAPSWNPKREPIVFGTVNMVEGAEPLRLDAELTTHLLDSLNAGLVPVFERPLQADTNSITSIALSPVNFLPAYRQYGICKKHLLPISFEQMKNTVIEFEREQSDLSAAAQKKIDVLLRYIALDRSVTHFEIRGVSNENKRRLDNLTLAKQRTQQVSEYLMSRGINAASIQTSYHGERLAANNQQRFVSIRLKRGAVAK
jgi:sodium-type flagellar protein MotY